MSMAKPLQDLEDAEHAFSRVRGELEALSVTELSTLNVDVVSAASIALGVSARITTFRERMAKLPEFELRYVDRLPDYAKAAWFAYVTNLPVQEESTVTSLLEEVTALRAKLLMWAVPLVGAGFFEEAAVARIREGSGHKDVPSDVVALVGLYRSRWDDVKNICAVTEEDLARSSQLAPALFAALSRRELREPGSATDGSLRVRRAWTLLERAYTQCRRALAYLRAEEGDLDVIAPNLRRNPGPPGRPSAEAPAATTPGSSGAPATVPPPSGVSTSASATTAVSAAAAGGGGARPVERGAVIDAGAPFGKKP